MTDLLFCKAAGLEPRKLEVRSREYPYASWPTWMLDAADVEAYLEAKSEKIKSYEEYRQRFLSSISTVSDEWSPSIEDLEKLYKLCEKKSISSKGDDQMPKMSDGFFKPDDFGKIYGGHRWEAAEVANRLLQDRGTVVYGWPDSFTWVRRHSDNTHQALLINIQPIEKADTAEGLLREALKCGELQGNWNHWSDRVKKLLEKE